MLPKSCEHIAFSRSFIVRKPCSLSLFLQLLMSNVCCMSRAVQYDLRMFFHCNSTKASIHVFMSVMFVTLTNVRGRDIRRFLGMSQIVDWVAAVWQNVCISSRLCCLIACKPWCSFLFFVMHSWMSIVHVMRRGLKYDMPNLVLFLFVFCFAGYGRFQESRVLVLLKLCSFPWRLSLPKLCRAAGSQALTACF